MIYAYPTFHRTIENALHTLVVGGGLFLTQTVVRGMVAAGNGGAIVNIGSMWAHQAVGATPSSAYSMGKGGLHALTHNLALELGPQQIRANAVPPAVVATPIDRAFVPPDEIEETIEGFNGFHPLGRGARPRTSRPRSPTCSQTTPAGSPERS